MEFKDNEAIYLQIAAYVSDQILLGTWPEEHRLPSVRELAGDLQVNPNTVMRTYDFLQQQQVIYNKRGIGFFVAPASDDKIKVYRRERFVQQELPEFFRTIFLLGISLDEVQQRYATYTATHFPTSPLPSVSHENQQ
ncbi:GntR family transcriptional regulator [Hymenobacter crusticola]|uniref:GntR family transcriptional regulator n=1 Tax=Hymenobacter crusticola TaxID=1770526 RepID=A0A243WA99_9BACT|nr:GntR family transcriptional regulator [Hymenobacter crusticola]OUJ72475.1 GntR family transcriptional regulator [Hymenobacter crusticola]